MWIFEKDVFQLNAKLRDIFFQIYLILVRSRMKNSKKAYPLLRITKYNKLALV